MFLGCENEVVVLVVQRLEGRPVNSRVSAPTPNNPRDLDPDYLAASFLVQ